LCLEVDVEQDVRDCGDQGVLLAGAADDVDVVRTGCEHIDKFADLLAGTGDDGEALEVIDVVLVVWEIGERGFVDLDQLVAELLSASRFS